MIPSIVLHGPESTGKSSLAARLAVHYGTVWVPEYGRSYCEVYGTDLIPSDLVAIMDGHGAARRAIEPHAHSLLIQDTDPVTTAAWSIMLFGRRMDALDAFADVGQLYLLMDIDLPWVGDAIRMYPGRADQEHLLELCQAELDRRALPYVVISGKGEARFEKAVAAIERAGLAPPA